MVFITSNLLTTEDLIIRSVGSFGMVANEKNEQLDFAAC